VCGAHVGAVSGGVALEAGFSHRWLCAGESPTRHRRHPHPAMEVEQSPKKDKFRGKLYSLTHESEWEDIGTGFVSIDEKDDPPGLRHLVFHNEEAEAKILHDRPVAGEGTYQLQGSGERQTIIVWEDPQTHQDFAISFQEVTGTMEIWQALSRPPAQPEKRLLPPPKILNLHAVSRQLMAVPPSQREGLANECISPSFISTLRESFHTAEDLGSEEHLSLLWLIAKGIFLLSNQKLTERYLRHDVYEDVMGMLEYDDGLPRSKRVPHRQVLKVKVCFKDVISFDSQETLERIHLNYRLQYLKDIVLPRLLDDNSFVSLTQMINFNLAAILDHLQSNKQLIQRLFQQIRQKDLQSLAFLQDVCRLAKILPPGERAALYDIFFQEKLFEVLLPRSNV
jgi:protein phosphatase-4 regulatory subunit 3